VIDFQFTIEFKRFGKKSKVNFQNGLNIIYGESGVGKTQFCKFLSGFDKKISQCNFIISELSSFNRSMYVQQETGDQIVASTIIRELSFNLENYRHSPGEISEKISHIVKLFGIDWDLNRHPSTLSGGEQQILNIASSLLLNPDVLIIDDGLSFLSKEIKLRIVSVLSDWSIDKNSVVIWMTSSEKDCKWTDSSWELTLDNFEPFEFKSDFEIDLNDIVNGRINLELNKLSFSYLESNPLFKDQTIQINEFRCLGIKGENGSGKSTLGRILIDLLKPESGKLELNLQDKSKITTAYLTQFPEKYFSCMTFKEILDDLSNNKLFNQQNQSLLKNELERMQIFWDRIKLLPINTLSISAVRMVLICLLSHGNYDLLILDEPTAYLGNKQRTDILSFLKKVMAKKHLILISHSESLIKSLCDKFILIKNGKLSQHHVGVEIPY
tara:strand:+ start:17413 stop:18732 length:1320 start_codon:yes stop_codon:yes gene_type:complete